MKNQRRLISFVVVLAVLLLGGEAWACIELGPWLTGVTQNSIAIRWETPHFFCGVDYGLTPALGQEKKAKFDAGVYQADLTGLETGAQYYYQIVCPDYSSETFSFSTAPEETAPFHFAVISDTQKNQDVHLSVVEALLNDAPDFVLHNGDLTEIPFLPNLWWDFWDVATLIADHTSYFPIMGNHEALLGGKVPLNRYFENPMNDGNVSRYSFQYGNTYFINLDVSQLMFVGSTQYKWLEAELARAKSLPGVKHCIVRAHFPPYSCSQHGNDLDVLAFRDAVVPLLEEYDVDLFFSGHDHGYQRSVVNGITYIVTGGAGGDLYDGTPQNFTVTFEKTHNYIHVEVDGTQIYVEARRPDDSVIESFTIDHDYHGSADENTMDDNATDDDATDDDATDDDATDSNAVGDNENGGCGS